MLVLRDLPSVASIRLPRSQLRVPPFRRAAATAFFPATTCDSARQRLRVMLAGRVVLLGIYLQFVNYHSVEFIACQIPSPLQITRSDVEQIDWVALEQIELAFLRF